MGRSSVRRANGKKYIVLGSYRGHDPLSFYWSFRVAAVRLDVCLVMSMGWGVGVNGTIVSDASVMRNGVVLAKPVSDGLVRFYSCFLWVSSSLPPTPGLSEISWDVFDLRSAARSCGGLSAWHTFLPRTLEWHLSP